MCNNNATQQESKHEIVREPDGTFKKGFSANPGGRFKDSLSFPEILRQLLAYKDLNEVDTSDMDEKQKLMLLLIQRAKGKDGLKALQMVCDRMEGSPVATQKIDLTSNKSPWETFQENDVDERPTD